MKKLWVVSSLCAFMLISSSPVVAAKTKYGTAANPLSGDSSYFRKAAAPDYWKLAPYYVPQLEGWSCSVASVAAVVNAARAQKVGALKLTSDDELATHKALLAKVQDDAWKAAKGVTLDQLGPIIEKSLQAYGLKGKVTVVHVENASAAMLKKLRAALLLNEKSANDFIVINFLQGVLTGDADVGHVSPLGAYDAKTHRALVMDVDRDWYEPYWVSDEVLLKSMATLDSGPGKNRGWVHVVLE